MDSLNPQIRSNWPNRVNPAAAQSHSESQSADRLEKIGAYRKSQVMAAAKKSPSEVSSFKIPPKQEEIPSVETSPVKSSFSNELKNGARIALSSTLYILVASARSAPRRIQKLGSRVLNAVRSEEKIKEIQEQSKKLRQNDLGL